MFEGGGLEREYFSKSKIGARPPYASHTAAAGRRSSRIGGGEQGHITAVAQAYASFCV